jgi:PAS domain S-box-containing protein
VEKALAEYLEHAPVFVRTLGGEIVYWPDGAQQMYGFTVQEAVGRRSHELLKTVFPSPLTEIDAALQTRGEWQGLLRHTCANGTWLWTESVWRLRKDDAGRPIVVEANTDVTQRELLARELDHRLKNTLAVVQSVARMTFSEADRRSVERFEARLIALSEAHELLLRHQWIEADLGELLRRISRGLNVEGRIVRDGPSVSLSPSTAISYSLAFHELGTNALKHGALSAPSGSVHVSWRVDDNVPPRVHLIWKEKGGPGVRPPTRRGFGTRLIERAISRDLGAPVQLHFNADGLVCELSGPVHTGPAALGAQINL